MAHFALFTFGGLVIYLSLNSFGNKYKTLEAVFFGMLMACLDEFHQLYSLNRSPRLFDVVIDTVGVITGVILGVIGVKILIKIFEKIEKGKKVYDKLQNDNSRKNCKSS